jgi:hypothetical protein
MNFIVTFMSFSRPGPRSGACGWALLALALAGACAYDSDTHLLQPRRQVYVVLTGDGGYFGVQLLKYYDDSGSGGYVQFRWKKVKPPSETRVPAAATPAGLATGP